MAATWGGLDGDLIWVYGVGWSWFVWVCLVWVDLGCGLIWVCVEAWRRGGVEAWRRWRFDRRWFSLCGLIGVGWSDVESNFSCGLIGMYGLIWFFFGFWWFFVWVDRYMWVDQIFLWFLMIFRVGWLVCVGWSDFCLVSDDGGDGCWVVMVVVMVAVGLWERGAVREWIIKISKIMNILINKCVE